MYAHIQNLVKSCMSCLEKRAHKPGKLAELQRLPIPDKPFHTVHLDASGPYPQTLQGNKYILAFVCAFSKWQEAYAVKDITADTTAEVLAEFICRHGCPSVLISDRGKNFLSKAIDKVYQLLNIKKNCHFKLPPRWKRKN